MANKDKWAKTFLIRQQANSTLTIKKSIYYITFKQKKLEFKQFTTVIFTLIDPSNLKDTLYILWGRG